MPSNGLFRTEVYTTDCQFWKYEKKLRYCNFLRFKYIGQFVFVFFQHNSG